MSIALKISKWRRTNFIGACATKCPSTGPREFCFLPRFRLLKKQTWRIVERCVRTRLLHGKIGDCEQSIQENIGEVLETSDRVKNSSDEQSDSVLNFIHRKDVLIVLPTGFGKS